MTGVTEASDMLGGLCETIAIQSAVAADNDAELELARQEITNTTGAATAAFTEHAAAVQCHAAASRSVHSAVVAPVAFVTSWRTRLSSAALPAVTSD